MLKRVVSELDWEIIEQYAEHDMNASETARANFMVVTTVKYHLNKVRDITGLNPYKFYDLIKLLKMRKGVSEDEEWGLV